MIPLKLQIILIIISSTGLLIFLNMIVKYKLELKYSLLWFLLSIITIVLAIFPGISLMVSNLFEIEKPVNVIFLFGMFLIITILFSLTITISNIQNKLKQLAQELGISKLENSELKKKLNTQEDDFSRHDS